jgi:uncharacterized membrane protein
MQGTALHLIAAVFFMMALIIIALLMLVYTYVDEIVRRVRAMAMPSVSRGRRISREENDAARKIISERKKLPRDN